MIPARQSQQGQAGAGPRRAKQGQAGPGRRRATHGHAGPRRATRTRGGRRLESAVAIITEAVTFHHLKGCAELSFIFDDSLMTDSQFITEFLLSEELTVTKIF